MLKSLLIHNDNTPLNIHPDISTSILFAPTLEELNNSDIDTYISKKILPQIKNEEFDIVFIRDTLSKNYIDFYGLVLAYHIRLSTTTLKKEQNLTPIVILSDIDSYIINKITSIGQILFKKNVFIAPNNKSTLDRFNNESFKPMLLTSDEYNFDFLDKINIKPPKDYLSHHSITNEWAIDQWSQILGITEKTKTNHEKISFMLYYKYLQAKYELDSCNSRFIKQKSYNGKVLLIDDKWKAGWKEIISTFIELHYTDVVCETVEKINKDSTFDEIESYVVEKIAVDNSPDVVLLDLRLLNNENEVNKTTNDKSYINKLSGIKILKVIKKLNPAIQIIAFTASSDAMILDEVYNNGILGYVKKDSPTNIYLAPKNSFSKLNTLLKEGLKRKYLKNIYEIQENILKLDFLKNAKLIIGEDNNDISIKNTIPQVFDILDSNLSNPFLYAMYAIFKCIEYINDMYFREQRIEGKWKAIWKDSDKLEMIAGYSTEDRIKAIIEQKLQIKSDQEWIFEAVHKIVCSRNYNIHGGEEKVNCKDGLIKLPTEKNIEEWFEMLYIILLHINRFRKSIK